MSNKVQNTTHWIGTLLLGAASFFFWFKVHPEALSWHEQNQMFLLTYDYLAERISVPGGFAEWIGEALTQFYFYTSIGAIIIAIVTMVVQRVSFKVLQTNQLTNEEQARNSWYCWALSFIPALLLWSTMGDINVMLAYAIAMLFTIGFYLLCHKVPLWIQLPAILALYWIAGPVFIIVAIWTTIDRCNLTKGLNAVYECILVIVIVAGWFYLCRTLWVAQYPWKTVLAGIGYHRLTIMTCEIPAMLYLTCAITAFLPLIAYTLSVATQKRHLDICTAGIVLILAVGTFICTISEQFDPNTYALLEQQYLMRKGDWAGIVESAEKKQAEKLPIVRAPEYTTGINLALAKTGQLSRRMFEFQQNGLQGLILPRKRDNISCVSSMEAFWQLGFINESMRYAFDLQESILNCRKSARYTLRLAECNIINGRYEVASKYIDQLKKTLFYRRWAELAEGYLYNEERINTYPEWQQKRQFRLEADFLYYYPQMHKMLGHLVLQNRQNTLAYDYMMASLLLIGDTQSYVANLPQQPKVGQNPFPKGFDQYVEYMKQQPNTDAATSASAIIK